MVAPAGAPGGRTPSCASGRDLARNPAVCPRPVLPRQFYLITRCCTQRQLLLRPDAATNNAFLYCLIDAAVRCAPRACRAGSAPASAPGGRRARKLHRPRRAAAARPRAARAPAPALESRAAGRSPCRRRSRRTSGRRTDQACAPHIRSTEASTGVRLS